MSETSRYATAPTPDCVTCHESSEHFPEIGVWACPFCGRLAIEYEDTAANGPVLSYEPQGDDPIHVIKVLGEIATHNGLKRMLGTPYHSKDDLLDLPMDATGRRWNPDRSAWTVDADAIGRVKDHLRDAGWPVIDFVKLRRERRREGQ